MRRVLLAVIGSLIVGSAGPAVAQTASPAPTVPPVETAAPTAPPIADTPAPESPETPVGPPADVVGEEDDDDGLSTTAIALIILAGVVLLLLVYALAWGPWRRPGEPGPR